MEILKLVDKGTGYYETINWTFQKMQKDAQMKMLGILHMAKDFLPIVRGEDYFHQPQKLGWHFRDERCYYNDLTGKAKWIGKCLEEVPALYVPGRKTYIMFPIQILQYGLGSLDRYFVSGGDCYRNNISNVTSWLFRNINSQGYFNNYFSELDPTHHYFSNNSAMTQGEALSFLSRISANGLAYGYSSSDLEAIMNNIFSNMIRPIGEEGTLFKKNAKVYFCEYCCSDDYIVLNGWIYAIFGLFDYFKLSKNPLAGKNLDSTLIALKNDLIKYSIKSGWYFYDNKGRLCSPFYQSIHIHLFDALRRLWSEPEFNDAYRRSLVSYNTRNKLWYTARKVFDKIRDKTVYAN